jgi:preprotein translocase subunit SecD
MASTRARITPFITWVASAIVVTYFLVSFDLNHFRTANEPLLERITSSIRVPNLNLGIDLQGGVRLVYSVDIDKALEHRLGALGRNFEKSLKRAPGKIRAVGRSYSDKSFEVSFKDSDSVQKAYELARDKHKDLLAKADGKKLILTLSPQEVSRVRATGVEQTVTVLKTRLDNFNVRGLAVMAHGDNSVVVQLPGVDDVGEIRSTIMRAARLELKIVEKASSSRMELLDLFDGDLPSDKMIIGSQDASDDDEEESGEWYLVSTFADLGGDRISRASAVRNDRGAVQISFTLNSDGAREIRELSRENINRSMAIIIDNRVISAPNINGELGAENAITGNFTMQSASQLSSLLSSGALVAPLKLEQETRVGSELGADARSRGLIACFVAIALLFLFSLFYYGFAGLCAFMALLFNLWVILMLLAFMRATLTLPGIAGMVLTVGMAIDASVLIFERIKELLAEGTPYTEAIKQGFDGAMTVILDSNFTTLLTGIVLFKFGGPAIRGFAVTLMAGIFSTIVAGVFFLRSLIDAVVAWYGSRSLKF